jgi:chromosome segregation ATPase
VFVSLLLIVFAVLSPAMAIAEDNTRGRLPDGRAYRIDKEGYRLVDQVAELEVTNDDLERQLRVLEDELRQLKRGAGASAVAANGEPVKEVDLLPSSGLRTAKLPPAKTVASQNSETPDCNDLVSSLYLKMAEMEKKLANANSLVQGNTSTKAVASQTACDYQSPANPLWNQVNELQNALMQGPSAEAYAKSVEQQERIKTKLIEAAAEKSRLAEKNEELSLSRIELEKKLNAQSERIAMQNAEIEQVRGVLKQQEVMLASLQTSKVEAERARAALRTPKSEPTTSIVPQTTSADIAVAKKALRAELKTIQSKIMKRKNLIDRLKKKGRGVSVSPQRLVSSKGASLDALRLEVKSLSQVGAARKIRLGLREISLVLDEDIKTMQRLIAG